jgi:acetyl-CoA carboxylase carboxyl transferase subunit beta
VSAPSVGAEPKAQCWVCCQRCRELIYARRLARSLQVCPSCGYHGRIGARERLDYLLDPGSFKEIETPATADDPLGFADTRPFADRLLAAREQTGLADAVVCGLGRIEDNELAVAAMDFAFLGGSLGCAVGEAIAVIAEHALHARLPLLLITASGGARMQEGALSLMQMAKTSQAVAALDEAGLLTISLITDPTYGGTAASFATLSDVILAEPGARLGFAGPRVIEQTMRQRLPQNFQTAEFLKAHGQIDAVHPRAALRGVLSQLIRITRHADGWADTIHRDAVPALAPDAAEVSGREAWVTVKLSRHIDRPTTLDYAGYILDEFYELHGDRLAADCPAIVGGIGRLGAVPLMIIGHQKGHNTRELLERNFGMPSPAGYRKAARLMRLAGKLGIPVVTLIDTPGAHPGIEAEENGQAAAIAENLRLMSGLRVPIVAVITGEGGSGGALALALADQVLALSNAVYSVISPEGCAAILWRDAAEAPQAAEELRLDTAKLCELGVVDAVIAEPPGGAHTDPAATASHLRQAIERALAGLVGADPGRLVARRRLRFRGFGGMRP